MTDEYELLGDDEDYTEGIGRRRRRKPRGRVGRRQALINARKRQLARLRNESRDQAAARKELIASQKADNLWTDPVSGEVFKVFPITLTNTNFTVTANTANSETTVGTYTVPNGIELLFRSVQTGVAGAYLDRAAPYLHGNLRTAANADVSGTVRIKVLDASQNDLKGQPFTGSAGELNASHAIDWNQRLFFNTIKPVRAKSGDIVQVTLNATAVISTSATYTDWTLHLLQLSKQ